MRQELLGWLSKTSKIGISTDFIRRILPYSQEGPTSTVQTGRETSHALPGSTLRGLWPSPEANSLKTNVACVHFNPLA